MNGKETNLPSYLNHPYDRFLALRMEFLILTQNELEAKIMRIIEMCIEHKRTEFYLNAATMTPKGQKITIPDDIWVTIPHRVFLDWLVGTVQSETTLKEAINSLCEKHLIFKKPGGTGPYDAMAFTLNKRLIQHLYSLLPKHPSEIDMIAVMKQPRKRKEVEGQKLTPSKIDPLVERIRESIIDPPDSQLLILPQSIIDPLPERGGGQKLTPNKNSNNLSKTNTERKTPASPESSQQNDSSSPSVNPKSLQLLSELNEQEITFWRWLCEIKNSKEDSLSEKDIPDIQVLAAEIGTREELQEYYDCEDKRLRDWKGEEAEPPNLKNLVKRLPNWKRRQARTSQDQPQDDWLTSMKARSGVRSGMMEKTARAKKGA